jgi:hypothetical protein
MLPVLLALVLGCNGKGDDSATGDDTGEEPDASTPSDPDHPLANCESLEHDDWGDGDGADDEFLDRFDENERHVYRGIDYGADHLWDYVYTSAYDTSGKLVEREDDTDGDGDIDEETIYAYDEEGRSETSTFYENGVLVEVWTYVYEGDALVAIEMDEGDDGILESVWHITTVVDGSGNTTETTEVDDWDDGTIDAMFWYFENAAHTEVELTADFDADGDIEHSLAYTVDEYGNVVTRTIESYDFDGSLLYTSSTTTDELDEWNRPSVFHGEKYYAGEGTFEMVGTYTYTCD